MSNNDIDDSYDDDAMYESVRSNDSNVHEWQTEAGPSTCHINQWKKHTGKNINAHSDIIEI